MLEEELRYLREDFTESLWVDPPVEFAARLAGQLHQTLYQKTGIEAWVNWADVKNPPTQESSFQQQRSDFVGGAKWYLHAAMIATQIYAVCVAVLILALPWIIYLAWPTMVHPNAVIVPFAVLFAFVSMVSAATFKKYL